MVTSRKPTVLAQKAPPKSRAKAKPALAARPEFTPRAGEEYRVRLTSEGPFGFEQPFYSGDEFDAELKLAEHHDAGLAAVLEISGRYGYAPRSATPVTIADLAADHLAREHPDKRWEILPEGQRRIDESLRP